MTNTEEVDDWLQKLISSDDTSTRSQVAIANVCFGASVGGGDFRQYMIEHNEEQTQWVLWAWIPIEAESDDDEEFQIELCRTLRTDEPSSPKSVAIKLLREDWSNEKLRPVYGTNFEHFSVDEGFLLSVEELHQIVDTLPE